jgi:two-component system, OmpR family, sensor histidine kinase CpxA
MRSLFLKIFLWFGLAMVLANVASFATGVLVERRFQPPRNAPMAPTIGILAQTAADTFERAGTPALNSFLQRAEQSSGVKCILFNEQRQELGGTQIVDWSLAELAARPSLESKLIYDFSSPANRNGRPAHAAQLVQTQSGATYILVARLPPPDFPRPPRIGEPGSLGFGLRVLTRTLLPLLLVGGLFCYLLARSLAKPIVKLRGTAHELSDGNLSARVDQSLIVRRDEIGSLGKDFNLMATHIESLVSAQRRLLADISHELRSPLARQGVALGIARRRGNPEVSPALERIGREASRMNEMIGQLLDLSRVESGTELIDKSRVDLASLVSDIVQDADYEARDNNRAVRLVSRDDCAVMGSFELLNSAIENVVRNALRHTKPETEVEVNLRCVANNGTVQSIITVRDHGAGVPEKALKEIFRPFYRVEDARDRKSGGTGLGLAIATRAVALHKGTINARNREDGGLEVEIRIPSV